MPNVEWLEAPEQLRSPVLVAAWSGWNDAAEAATGAVRFLRERWPATKIAQIDPEEFYDFTQARPMIRLLDGSQRSLDWPQNQFYISNEPLLPHDFVLFIGVEPHLKWRAYTQSFGEVMDRLGVRTVVTLGGLLADATHTRPVPITGFSNEPAMAQQLLEMNVRSTRYEGPTGIVGVMHDYCRSRDVASASFWASAPAYISGMAYPQATLALLGHVDQLFRLDLDTHELVTAAERLHAQISEAVSRNSEIAEYIGRLERRVDEELGGSSGPPPDLPTGRELIRDLEEFLKQSREPGESEGL